MVVFFYCVVDVVFDLVNMVVNDFFKFGYGVKDFFMGYFSWFLYEGDYVICVYFKVFFILF